jgi:coproporphyrinogen III oxidase-like Fe-S oxidoreductase
MYKEIAFDLLIGQPGQTVESMEKTCDEILRTKTNLGSVIFNGL